MINPYPTSAIDQYRAGVEALDEAYRLVEQAERPAEGAGLGFGPDREKLERMALVRTQIARAHFAASHAVSAGMAVAPGDWAVMARERRDPGHDATPAGEVRP